MEKDNKLKLNNNGSTFLFVVISLIFIGLLATLILALSAASFKMKNVDYNARQNFYEGEEFSGKIYSEIGMNALGILGESYVTTMGKLKSGAITNENSLNQHIKELYYQQMLVYLRIADTDAVAKMYVTNQQSSGVPITLSASDSIVTGKVLPLLESMLVDPEDPTASVPEMEITGSVVCDLEGAVDAEGETYPTITINDVHIQHIDSETRFESNYTFDIVVRYPEWDFTFSNPVSVGTDIDTFLDYILISTDGIVFDGVNDDVFGCVATGSNSIIANNDSETQGLRFKSGATVDFYQSGATLGSYKYEPLEIVVTDNVVIDSSATRSSSMTVNNGELWCNSVLLQKEKVDDETNTNKSYFESKNSVLYIQDDLQLDGVNSDAKIIGGSYFGYSNNTGTDYNDQHSSSAIIINGNNASVNLSGLDKLYVNGLAYIDYINHNEPYRTGETLAVKGNQDIYMVADAYMGDNFSNPVSEGRGMTAYDESVIANNLLTKFFGKDYLDPAQPFIKKSYYINKKNYTFYYLNFASPSLQTEYVTTILADYNGTDEVRKSIREKVLKNLSEMNMSTDKFLSAEANTIYTAGALVTAAGGDRLGSVSATNANTAGVLVEQVSFINRYRLMKSLLMSMSDSNAVISSFNDVPSKVFAWLHDDNPEKYPTPSSAVDNYLLNNSTVENIINVAKLRQYVTDSNGEWSRSHPGGTLTYARRTAGNVYTLGNYTGIVVVDGDVEIRGNVTGLVIATGSITVTGSGTLVSDANLVHSILEHEQDENVTETDGPRSDVFKAYPIPNPKNIYGESISQLQYSDVLYYDNWRRYDDTATY